MFFQRNGFYENNIKVETVLKRPSPNLLISMSYEVNNKYPYILLNSSSFLELTIELTEVDKTQQSIMQNDEWDHP